MMLDGIELVVFDATGTLLEPDPAPELVYHQVGLQFGITQSIPQTAELFGQALKTHFGSDAPEGDLRRPQTNDDFERQRWYGIVRDCLPELSADSRDRAFAILWEHFAKPGSWRIFDDVEPTLNALAARGIQTSLGSNFDRRLHHVAKGSELSELTFVMSSAELGYSKPDGRFFEAVCQKTKLAPEQMLMVGDDPLNDIKGATAAGWNAVLIDRQQRFEGGISNLTDLVK